MLLLLLSSTFVVGNFCFYSFKNSLEMDWVVRWSSLLSTVSVFCNILQTQQWKQLLTKTYEYSGKGMTKKVPSIA